MKHKYIVVRDAGGKEAIIIFPTNLIHAHMAKGHSVVSAGFVEFDKADAKLLCSGMSESLGIKSRPAKDTALANALLA